MSILAFHFDPPDDDSNRNHKQEVPQNTFTPNRILLQFGGQKWTPLPSFAIDLFEEISPSATHPGCPCTLSLLLDLFRKREEWCSATALLAVTANKMLMHLGHAAAQMLREKKAPGSPLCSHSVLLGFDDLTTTGRSFSPSLKHFQSRKSLEDPLHTLQSVCEDGAAGLQESLPGVGIATLQRMRQYTTSFSTAGLIFGVLLHLKKTSFSWEQKTTGMDIFSTSVLLQ